MRILLATFSSSNSFAGDNAELQFIAFSEDGKSPAFEESGEWDVSGGNYATAYYVDVAKIIYALKPSVFEFNFDSMKERERITLYASYKRSLAAGLKKSENRARQHRKTRCRTFARRL